MREFEIAGSGYKFRVSIGTPEADPSELVSNIKPIGSGDYYVYAHRDVNGSIFYIGKGSGDRAFSRDRHPVWTRYVEARSRNTFTVQILSRHATGEEAEEIEGELIGKYGKHLVNWINPGRKFDYPACELFHQLRNANRRFCGETRSIEENHPELAVERYQKAFQNIAAFNSIVMERGLVAELQTEIGIPIAGNGEIDVLNRITLVLKRLRRYPEIEKVMDDFVREFPAFRNHSRVAAIRKRSSRAAKPQSSP